MLLVTGSDEQSDSNMRDPVFGTLLVLADDQSLIGHLCQMDGWHVAVFEPSGAGYMVTWTDWRGFVDFAAAPLPFLNAAAIICTERTFYLAGALIEASGLIIYMRQMHDDFNSADRRWLETLSVRRFGEMLSDLVQSQASVAVMRTTIDDLRTNLSLLEHHLHRHDVPPLRKIWHVPYLEGIDVEISGSIAMNLPVSSWGLTRLQLWIAAGKPQDNLVLQLLSDDRSPALETWSISPAHANGCVGWLSFDLDRSLASYGTPLRLLVIGRGWRLGGSAPWCRSDADSGAVVTFEGLALRIYSTLPGVQGPRSLLPPVDDRRRSTLTTMELATARALNRPDNLSFEPVGPHERGLLVHPVAGDNMVAIITDSCPALAVSARLSVLHGHLMGSPFLITLTTGSEATVTSSVTERADEVGVIEEVGPLRQGEWCRIAAGAQALVNFSLTPSCSSRDVRIISRAADGDTNLAWAIITSIEFTLADG